MFYRKEKTGNLLIGMACSIKKKGMACSFVKEKYKHFYVPACS